jgi:signal peptidase I
VIVLASSGLLIYTYSRKVTGISMLPTLEEGDLVVIQPVPITQISVGDIIVYDPPCSAMGTAVIHRVVNVAGNGFITKGDNNQLNDQAGGIALAPVTPGCIEGKVVFVIPYLEKLSELPYGINYIIAATIVIYVLYGELRAVRPEAQTADKEDSPKSSGT